MKREEGRKWRGKRLAGWRESGLTQEAYCKREGIALQTLRRWQRKLREPAARWPVPARFAPVGVADTRLSSTPRSRHTPPETLAQPVEIILASGRRLKLTSGLDESGLARLIRLLEVLPC